MSFRRLASGVAFALTLLVPAAARAEVKVAVVDRQAVASDLEEFKAAKSRLQATLNAKQKDLEKEKDSLTKEREMLDKQMETMNDEAKRAKRTEFEQKAQAFALKFQRSQAELAEAEQKEMEAINGRMQQVIEQVAQREGFTLILDKHPFVLYSPRSLDVTNDVVRLYNEMFKGKPLKGSTGASKPADPKKPAPADAPKK